MREKVRQISANTKTLSQKQNLKHQPSLLTNRKSTYEALTELSKIFLNRLNIHLPPRVTKKAPVPKIRQSPRLAKKATYQQIRQSPRVAKKATCQHKDNTKKNEMKMDLIHNPLNVHSDTARAKRARNQNKVKNVQHTTKSKNTPKPVSVTQFGDQIEPPPIPYDILQEDAQDKINCLYKVNTKKHKIFNHISKKLEKYKNKSHLIEPDTHLINNVMNTILDKETGELLEYRQLVKGPNRNIWTTALANHIG